MTDPKNIGNPEENTVNGAVPSPEEAGTAVPGTAAGPVADGIIAADAAIGTAPEETGEKATAPKNSGGENNHVPVRQETDSTKEDAVGTEKETENQTKKGAEKEMKKEPEKKAKKAEAKPLIREELHPLRGESRKVFRRSDGMEEAVFYARPVHLPDGKGGFSG